MAGRALRTTPEHPFYVRGAGWIPAGQLEPGDLLSTPGGEWLPVERVADTRRVAHGLQLPRQRVPYVLHRAAGSGVRCVGA